MSDVEESLLDPSDPETQFVPQEDDDETLWEVIEITAEKPKLYKVRWKGVDPQTQKPWPQSWVAKHDCTDDLVRDWKLRQAKKKKGRESKKFRTSITTAKSSTSSKTRASPSKSDSAGFTRRSTSTTTAVTPRRGRSKATNPSPSKSTRSRTPLMSTTRTSPSPGLNDNAPAVAPAPSVSAKTGAKRKHGETTSATTSTRIPNSRSAFLNADAKASNSISGSVPPPRKKRKLEVEIVNNNEHSVSSVEVDSTSRNRKVSPVIASDDDDDDHGDAKSEPDEVVINSQSAEEDNDEEKEDERMVEESLSDMYYSPRPSSPLQEPSHNPEEQEVTPTPPVQAQNPAHTRQDLTEESTPTVFRPQRGTEERMDSFPPRASSKTNPPIKKGVRPSSPSPSSSSSSSATTEPHSAIKHHILGQVATPKKKPGANTRKMTSFLSKQQWKALDDFSSQQPAEVPGRDKSEKGPSEEEPDLEELPSVEKPVLDQASRSRAESAAGSGSHSLGRGTKSIPRSKKRSLPSPSATPSTSIAIPTAAPDGNTDNEEDSHRSPILSPRAKKRLRRFDESMMMLGLKEKDQPLEDEKAQKSRERKREAEKDEEVTVAGGSVKEHGFERTFKKSRKGKEKDEAKDDTAQDIPIPKPPVIEKKKSEPLFLPGETDFEDGPAVRSKRQDKVKGKSKSRSTISKETSHPPSPSYEPDSDSNHQARLSTHVGSTNTKSPDREITSKAKPPSKPQSQIGAQARPTTSTTNVRRPANARPKSFVNDIIPESEESQSRSQETDSQGPTVPHPPIPPATPASKLTLKSRMKPKTPQLKTKPLSRTSSAVGALALGVKLKMDMGGGNNVHDDDLDGVDETVNKVPKKKASENGATTKPLLGPIPRISPSVFAAHLPSSLPDSVIESAEGDGASAIKRVGKEDDDSIEQFESPKKDSGERKIGVLNAASRQEREKPRTKESASDIWNSDFNRRGQELAEAARKREKARLRAEEKSPLPVSTSSKSIPQAKTTSGYLVKETLDRLPALHEEEMDTGVPEQSLPPDLILPPPDVKSIVRQMEDAYVDLSGGVHEDQTADPATVGANTSAMVGIEGSQSIETELTVDKDIDSDTETGTGIVKQQPDFTHLRQEEEESSQDLMMGQQLYQQQEEIGVGQSGILVPEAMDDSNDVHPVIEIDSQPISEAMLEQGVSTGDAGNNDKFPSLDDIPSIIVENPSRASLPRSYSSLEGGDGLSRSKDGSHQNRKTEKPDPEAEIPPTASTHRESIQGLSQPAVSQAESAENPHHLGAAMHLLNIKSEEISKLEDQLSAEQQRNKDLLQQLSTLHESTLNAPPATKNLEQELADARAQLALHTASWEVERAALVLNIETATRSKVSAEQDRDFFREQYAKASGFVSSVRDENTELEKQVKIATEQAQSGVSMIRTTFEMRTKSLEEDARAWRRMAEFLIEKDRRTNDDIRRRAAEEPELRAKCDRQEGAIENSSVRILQLEVDLEEKERMFFESEVAGKRLQEVTVKLNLELNEAKTKLERIGKVGISDDDESAHPNGHEFVYRCQWRPDDSNDPCEAVFLNLSDLQEHVYTGGHLQLD